MKKMRISMFVLAFCMGLPFLASEGYAADEPLGQGRKAKEIFGRQSGYFHPYLSVSQLHSDNIYNTKDNPASDFYTIISPGLWLSIPGTRQKSFDISTSTMAPGGFTMSRDKIDSFRRYQAGLSYGADIVRYHDKTEENVTDHNVGGFFQLNLKGGLSIDLIDQYVRGHDPRGTGDSNTLDKYKTNLFATDISYDVSEKFRLRASYSNFYVGYDDGEQNFRDRTDDSISAYIFYKFMPKTSFFVEYTFIDVDYDLTRFSDSEEDHVYGGLKWDVSKKTQGQIKAGYLSKDFDQAGFSDSDEFVLQLVANYQISPKTSLSLSGARRANETTIDQTNYTLSHNASLSYNQKLTNRISCNLGLAYTNDEYDGAITVGGVRQERDDDIWSVSPGIQYAINDWLAADFAYTYSERDSNFDTYDYENNTVFIRLSAAM